MTELVIRTSKITALADVVSAYSLAYVVQLYLPIQAFLPGTVDANASQGLALALLGGVFTSLLIIIDPVNKIINRVLPRWLASPSAWWKPWAMPIARRIIPKKHAPGTDTEDQFFLLRGRYAYWSIYMSKWRTQMSSGIILSAFLFGFTPRAFALNEIGLGLAIFAVGAVVFYSVSRDLRRKIPGYCWIIAIYGLMIQFMPKEERDSLDRIAKHLSDANWTEAVWWMGQTVEGLATD